MLLALALMSVFLLIGTLGYRHGLAGCAAQRGDVSFGHGASESDQQRCGQMVCYRLCSGVWPGVHTHHGYCGLTHVAPRISQFACERFRLTAYFLVASFRVAAFPAKPMKEKTKAKIERMNRASSNSGTSAANGSRIRKYIPRKVRLVNCRNCSNA